VHCASVGAGHEPDAHGYRILHCDCEGTRLQGYKLLHCDCEGEEDPLVFFVINKTIRTRIIIPSNIQTIARG
jgi:hypothetical protein